MRAVVVYESMFGNTHLVAERIAEGLSITHGVDILPVGEAIGTILHDVDLLVVGGPTHVHGMSTSTSRRAATEQAADAEDLDLDPDAEGPGLRDWFDGLPRLAGRAAAFDTRIDGPPMLTGRASKGIARRLKKHGFELVGEPESFLVDQHHHLLAGEADRAVAWGARLSGTVIGAG